jgi:hypothetical protein
MPISRRIGSGKLNPPQIYQYNLANIVPETATQVLLYATIYSGNTYDSTILVDVSIFVYVDEKRLAQHLFIIAYRQDAYSSNTNNMWFPVPSNKMLYIQVPVGVPGWTGFWVDAIGYC